MIKLFVVSYCTEFNTYGNRYFVSQAISVKTGQSFYFKNYSETDFVPLIKELLKLKWEEIYLVYKSIRTGSARISSLPEAKRLSRRELAEELRGIGFFVAKSRVE